MQPTRALQITATMLVLVLSGTQAAPVTRSHELNATPRAGSSHTPHALNAIEARSDEGTPVKYWKRGEAISVRAWKREEPIPVQEWRRQTSDISVQEWRQSSPENREEMDD